MKKKAVVRRGERDPNVVDTLKLAIKDIQRSCKHNFRLLGKPSELRESRVLGVHTEELARANFDIHDMVPGLQCLRCSQGKGLDIREVCPRCLSPMVIAGHGRASAYFHYASPGPGIDEDFAAQLYRCSACDFKLAVEVSRGMARGQAVAPLA